MEKFFSKVEPCETKFSEEHLTGRIKRDVTTIDRDESMIVARVWTRDIIDVAFQAGWVDCTAFTILCL